MLMQCDATALEIRVAGYLSQDPVLLDELVRGVDIHTQTTKKDSTYLHA